MAPSDREPSRGVLYWIGWVLATLVGAYHAYVLLISSRDDPEATGFVLGYMAGTVGLAMAIRLIYVRLRPRDRRPPFWSPWIVVIAGIVFLIARLGNASS
jgi:drug/metabolite transporter (DMT)-like permease